MSKISKRLKKIKESMDTNKIYPLSEAIEILKTNSTVKFDETLDIAIQLSVDPKYSDQMVRGVVNLPHGTGKKIKVAVFAKGDKAKEAKEAGADIVGDDDLIEAIQKGNINFQKCIATPDMMMTIGKVAKILGPKGLMPNPKLGSVTLNVANAVKEAKSGQVEFRVEKAGIVHAPLGKLSFKADDLKNNVKALLDSVLKAKPSGAKGTYMNGIVLTSTMGIGLKVDADS